MIAIVFSVQTDFDTFSAAMDARKGYPKDGVNVGGGVHVPRAQGRTLRHGDKIRHPTLALWRYPDDVDVEVERVRGLAIPASGVIQVLDGTWGQL